MEFNLFEFQQQNGVNRIVFQDRIPFKSVVWEEKFNDVGKLQAVFPKTDDAVSKLKVGKLCTLAQGVYNSSNIMYIHSIKITDKEVWVYGAEAKVLWQKKAMMNIADGYGDTSVEARLEDAITTYGSYSFLQDAYFLDLGTANLDTLEYHNVYEFVTKVLGKYSAGWRVSFDEQNGVLNIFAREGVDKSDTVRFATILGNAAKTEYTANNQNYINRVYCVGQSGDDVVIEVFDKTNNDNEIYSAYLDVRSEFPRPDDMTLADYKAALATRAEMSAIARYTQEKIKISDVDASEYGTEYTLGDVVGVVLDDLHTTVNRRVTGITRVLEGNLDRLSIELSAV